MKFYPATSILVLLLFISGCAGVEVPRTEDFLRQPLGKGGLTLGMSQAQVLEKYGPPDIKSQAVSPGWRSSREEWVYGARYSGLPVGVGYLAEDLYLYFDGDNLTNISNRPLGVDPEEEAVSLK